MELDLIKETLPEKYHNLLPSFENVRKRIWEYQKKGILEDSSYIPYPTVPWSLILDVNSDDTVRCNRRSFLQHENSDIPTGPHSINDYKEEWASFSEDQVDTPASIPPLLAYLDDIDQIPRHSDGPYEQNEANKVSYQT